MPESESGIGAGKRENVRQLVDHLFAADPRAVARSISLVEDDTPAGRELLDLVYAQTGRARRIGITGPPGSGKSTLVNSLAHRLRAQGERVAVLAVDPTSPFSGGAILGDRVRMTAALRDRDLFVRSMASRGSLGGVSPATYEASEILEAAGYSWILIETVGVGQAELEIVEMADTVILLLVPESGDAMQVMKAGIMEIADVFVINKYDREGGDRLASELRLAMELSDWSRGGGWLPPICPTVAVHDEGVDEVLAAAMQHYSWLTGAGDRLTRSRRDKMQKRLRLLLNRALLAHAWKEAQIEDRMAGAIERIAAREISPYRWVGSILEQWEPQEGDGNG